MAERQLEFKFLPVALRFPPGIGGRFFKGTDDGTTYFDDGFVWQVVGLDAVGLARLGVPVGVPVDFFENLVIDSGGRTVVTNAGVPVWANKP